MKRLILTTFILLLFLSFDPPVVVATSSKSKVPTPTPIPTVKLELGNVLAVSTATKVDYILPYPGLLPDHPLYFLKKFRDTLFENLIVDPLRKGEFFVLQADKNINASIFLFDQTKGDMGREMAVNAEGYMGKAVEILTKAKTAGKEMPASLIDKLQKATAKHVEVLNGLLARASSAQKEGLTKALEAVKRLQSEIEKLK